MSKQKRTQSNPSTKTFRGAGNFSYLKIPLLFLCLLTLAVSASADTHTATVELTPEWSAAGQNIEYTMETCNDGPDAIDEVRIFANPNYSNFDCEEVAGWTLVEIQDFPSTPFGQPTDMCWYYTGTPLPSGNCEEFDFSATVPQSGCDFTWYIETRDEQGTGAGDWETWSDTTSVDDMEPVIVKTLGDPKVENGTTWITQNTNIKIEAYDQGSECGLSGLNYCEYRYDVDGQEVLPWTQIQWQNVLLGNPPHYFFNFDFDEDSEHFLEIRCYDVAGNEAYHSQTDKVDTASPITTKVISEPKKIEGDVEWVDTTTVITLTSVDPDPTGESCNIGVDKIYWANTIVDDIHCWKPENLDFCNPVDVHYNVVEGNEVIIQKENESCHLLQYYAVDELGNAEEVKTNCFFVDKTAPKMSKEVGIPNVPCRGDECLEFDFWVRDNVTEITMDCDDSWGEAAPHPSGDEEVCYKVSYDLDPYDLTVDYCPEGLETVTDAGYEGDWCCVDAPKGIIFVEDSLHDLEYFCRDAVNKKSVIDKEWFRVDSQPPIITKEMIGLDHLGYDASGALNEEACPPRPGMDDTCYVRDDGVNGVSISVVDDDIYNCAVDDMYCYYELWWEGEMIGYAEFSDYAEVIFHKDSEHQLYIYCKDALGNWVDDWETFLVDSTPPETTKTYGEPYVEDWFPKGCYESCEGNPACLEERCGYAEWITTHTPVYLDAWDEKVGVDEIYWRNLLVERSEVELDICGNPETYCHPEFYGRYVLNPNEPWNIYDGNPFYKQEESCHIIEYYSVDKLGNEELLNWQCVFVDDSYPEVWKLIGEPQMEIAGDLYITKDTPVTLYCEDVYPHPVDHVSLWYRYRVSDDCASWGDWTDWVDPNGHVVEKTIFFPEDSCHELEYYCEDGLGNTTPVYSEIDIVDTQGPVINKTLVGPRYPDDPEVCPPNDKGDVCFIDGITEIHVNAVDPEPHPVDEVLCDWEYIVLPTGPGGGATGVAPPFVINFPEESEHVLTITCRDALGNETVDIETFIVDKTPPIIEKEYEGPQYSGGLPEYSFQTYSREVDDSGSSLEVTVEDDGTWIIWTFDFPVEEFTGNGNLNVGLIIATDGEGNGPAFQIHNNDGATGLYPVGTWMYGSWGPTIGDGWFGWPNHDLDVPITGLDWVEAIGQRNTPWEGIVSGDGVMEIKIKKSVLGESFHWAASPTVGSGFFAPHYDVTMQIPSAFGWSTPLVDMGVPNYEYAESVKGEYPKWINSTTSILMSAFDPEPHPSGLASLEYRISLMGSNDPCESTVACQQAVGSGNFEPVIGEVSIQEDSCHLIEIVAIDNVDKTTTHKQCVFVDNQAPEPDKDVGEPRTPWDGLDSIFYDIDVFCETPENCWKVTLLTPINLECVDPDPHPVDHETVCFKVELDGDDATERYCNSQEINGEYNANEDGYCCMDKQTPEFYFQEETEHNLKYYCEDALGNIGPIDDEKFKVEGRAFEIELNKKWNLISVPFVLLNNDIEAVLESVEGNVDSVWTYDAVANEWQVYNPTNPGISSLGTMDPGIGYWVAMLEEDLLTIGGSLFSPGVTPPDRPLEKGWNLIGYYGTDGMLEYDGPDTSRGAEAGCKLYSLGPSILDKGWSALLSYWEPYNPNQWNTHGPQPGLEYDDRMDPGAGYWISVLDDGYTYLYRTCESGGA